MMMSPPAILIHGLLKIEAPTSPAVVPSAKKIIDSPALKASEFRITALRVRPLDPPSFTAAVEVNVVNVDVHVTDANGKPVTGLRKGDFELFEDGKRVDIANFAAVERGVSREDREETPAPSPEPAAAEEAPAAHVEAEDRIFVRGRVVCEHLGPAGFEYTLRTLHNVGFKAPARYSSGRVTVRLN